MMDDWIWIVIAAAVVVILVLVVLAVLRSAHQRHRSRNLQSRFGPEYDRTVKRSGRDRGEEDLEERVRAHEERPLREISPEQRERALAEWRALETRFVDSPVPAVRDADHLVYEMLRERGYPLDTVDDRAEALSVERPDLAVKYRDAHQALVAGEERGDSDVTRLRDAMLTYRDLLNELVGTRTG